MRRNPGLRLRPATPLLALALLAAPAPAHAGFLDTLGNLWDRTTEAAGNLWERGRETVSGWLNGRRAADVSGLLDQVERAQEEVAEKEENLREFVQRVGPSGPSASVRPYLQERVEGLESSRRSLEALYSQLSPALQEAARGGGLSEEDRTRAGQIQRRQQQLSARLESLRSTTSRWPAAARQEASPPSSSTEEGSSPAAPPAHGGSPGAPTPGASAPPSPSPAPPTPPPATPGPTPSTGPTHSPPSDAPVAAGTSEPFPAHLSELPPATPLAGTPEPQKRFVDSAAVLGSEGEGAARDAVEDSGEESPLLEALEREERLREGLEPPPGEGDDREFPSEARAGGEAPAPAGGSGESPAAGDALPALSPAAADSGPDPEGPLDPNHPRVAGLIDEWLDRAGLDPYGRWVAPGNITARGSAETDGRTRAQYVWDTLRGDPAGTGTSLEQYVRQRLAGGAPPPASRTPENPSSRNSARPAATAAPAAATSSGAGGSSDVAARRAAYDALQEALASGDRQKQREAYLAYQAALEGSP